MSSRNSRNSRSSSVEFSLDGQLQCVPEGVTVAAALCIADTGITRISVSGERRAAFCGMGICQECRVLINGQRRLACQTLCTAGMTVQTAAAAMAGARTTTDADLEHCDLLIVGAGPAGMAAALAAAPTGAAITLIDDNPAPGGQIWREGPGAHLPRFALQRREALARHSNVRLLSGTRVVAVPQPKQLLLEDAERGWRLGYDKLIVCTGARELLLPFPGWTLPGVTGAGGLQALIKGGLPVRGERIVLAGSGPLLLAVAAAAQAAGAQVLRVAEQASMSAVAAFAASLVRWPAKALQALTLMHPGYRLSSHVVSASGQGRVELVRLQQGARTLDIACDRLACGYGLIPNTQLGQALGCALNAQHAIAVDACQASSLADHYAAGECTGIGGSDRALVQGAIAGHAAVGQLDQARRLWPQRQRWEAFAANLHTRFALQPGLQKLAMPDTLVCRCEDVRHGELCGFESWTEAKLYSRCGMGACQGRVCGSATQFLFGWPQPAPRMPISPARIATLVQGATRSL